VIFQQVSYFTAMFSVDLLQYVVFGLIFFHFKCCLLLCCQGSNLKTCLHVSNEETVPVVQCGWNSAPHSVCCQWIRFSPAQHSNIDLLHETIIRIDSCFIFQRALSLLHDRIQRAWMLTSNFWNTVKSNPVDRDYVFQYFFSCRS